MNAKGYSWAAAAAAAALGPSFVLQRLEDAMTKYEASIPAFIEQHLINIEGLLQRESDEESRAALQQSHRELLQQQEEYKREGLRVMGIALRGKGRGLERFQRADSSIRVIELRRRNHRESAILPIHYPLNFS